jgi:hypothetical protein
MPTANKDITSPERVTRAIETEKHVRTNGYEPRKGPRSMPGLGLEPRTAGPHTPPVPRRAHCPVTWIC